MWGYMSTKQLVRKYCNQIHAQKAKAVGTGFFRSARGVFYAQENAQTQKDDVPGPGSGQKHIEKLVVKIVASWKPP